LNDGAIKEKGIRWLALNEGIRWVSLNEREKEVNGRGVKEDMKGKNTREKGTFGGALFFILGDCIGAFFLGDWKTVLLVFG
jgi:hypothetical protein